PVNGAVFHLLRRERDQDFTTAYDRGVFADRALCRRVAYSCFVTLVTARHFATIQPQVWRGVAQAELKPEHGAIKHTPTNRSPEHHSLWLRARYDVRV